MKKILGLDVGSTSIGWAYTNENESSTTIIDLGSRIIPLSSDDEKEFSQGNAISKNQGRTLKRTQRKGYDRYQLRRVALHKELSKHEMLPYKTLFIGIAALELYGLREKALTEQISLAELGRIFFHLNQKRGYKSSRKDENTDAKLTEYETQINNRYDEIVQKNWTVGQYFYEGLKRDSNFRVKEKIFPRAAYIHEFNRIWDTQKEFYPTILNAQLNKKIRNEIIFYQRPLKSQKGLVSVCEFEGKWYKNKEGKEFFGGPKVAPRSSPLFQVCKLWESINNISIKNRRGVLFEISLEKKNEIYNFLDINEKLSQTELFKILGIGKNDGYYANTLISKKGLQGNLTKAVIIKVLGQNEKTNELLKLTLSIEEYEMVNTVTGEIEKRNRLTPAIEQQTLYKLWHVLYSIPEEKDILKKLKSDFGVVEEDGIALSKIDFTKGGFGNKSAKAIRNILPYLQEGFKYSDACMMCGYNHSDSITKEENVSRILSDKLKLLPKGSLRQPVVEKILNQLINLVNALIETHGKPDEIRVELARELKQSKDERNDAYLLNNKRNAYHEKIEKTLLESPEFEKKKVTRRDIDRYKLWEEFGQRSPYEPNKIIGLSELYSGLYDIEHIIPKSRLFDDSFGNKTICPRHLNSGEQAKNQMTAFDFMHTRSTQELDDYLTLIDDALKNKKISKSKRDKLLMASDKIPQDFIARQLRETQYISRKAKEILSQISRNVWATSGSVTNYLRHEWGWDDVLKNLHWETYSAQGKTKVEKNDTGREVRIIEDWSKRDDHRHHAIDALVIACTKQGVIQRLNNLNQMIETKKGQSKQEALKKNPDENLKNFIEGLKPFSTKQVEETVSKILVSFKAGKKVATFGKRKVKRDGKKVVVQENIIVPRGSLSEESVYGKIQARTYTEVRLSPSFKDTDSIADKKVKEIIKKRLAEFDNDPAKAFKGLAKNPIWLDSGKTKMIEKVQVMKFSPEYVIRYPVKNITVKDLDSIVDRQVRDVVRKRLAEFNNNPKEAFKDLSNNPMWMNKEKGIAIKSVRCLTGLNIVEPIKVNDTVQNVQYEKYVKPGSNHHIAIYLDKEGKRQEHVVTFWHAVERKKRRIPVVITNPENVWNKIEQEEKEDNDFLSKLPDYNWTYLTSMQQNEMFVFNLSKEAIGEALSIKDFKTIGKNIFRVRKLTSGHYWFNQQYETQPHESIEDKKAGRCIQASLGTMNGVKVKVNNLGNIIKIGEENKEKNITINSTIT